MAVSKKSMINSKTSKKPAAKKASPKADKPAAGSKLTTAFYVGS